MKAAVKKPGAAGRVAARPAPTDNAALQAECEALRKTIRGLDDVVRSYTGTIAAVCRAAAERLALHPDALVDVRALLMLAADRAQYLADVVDGDASERRCSGIDEVESAEAGGFEAALWRDWHRLQAGGQAQSTEGRV